MRHIANGDSLAQTIRLTGIGGPVTPWRDVLHEGPVPAGSDLADLSRIRAAYLASCGHGAFDELAASFLDRDAFLAEADGDEIVLWFEHDLYDQLQLLQVLSELDARDAHRVTLVSVDRFPGHARFMGLGELNERELTSLFVDRSTVTPAQFEIATRAWRAFRAAEPSDIETLAHTDGLALPFLAAALRRLIEDYPGEVDGLARIERAALTAMEAGARTFGEVFTAATGAEAAPFIGDSTLFDRLATMTATPYPLVEFVPSEAGARMAEMPLRITPFGRAVLAGERDAIDLNGIDRWIGGVHLAGRHIRWRSRGDRLIEVREHSNT